MNAPNIRLIRIDGIVPQNKAAIREALEVAPGNVVLIATIDSVNDQHADRLLYLETLEPGASIAFTDGAGKYYGLISRSMDGKGYVLDKSTSEKKTK